jgi:hypothetical protein
MNLFIRFMASPAGRILRLVAGAGIIAWGLMVTGGDTGKIIAAIGMLPILTGALNICVVAPLLGGPLSGSKVRASQN